MFANERMSYICELLKKNGAVTTAQISKELNVSVETVRRDFLALEEENRLVRVHGGAVFPTGSVERLSLEDRIGMNREGKRVLSESACDFIKDGDIIAIDTGSTAAEFADILRLRFNELTVITHSIDVFERLQGKNGFKIILVGGTFMPDEKAFCGITALETYKMLHFDKVFITPAAVSLKNGITDCGEVLMTVERQMLESADQVFVLADSEKFEKTALYRLAPMNTRFTIVTDSGLSEELKALYEENGITVAVKG